MADENKPAFYPRVGNIKAKNFKPAKPMPFIDDERAMDLPQYVDVDLSQPTKANLEMGRRMAERDAQLKRQAEADRSPLEKLAGGVQAGRFLGSALTQAINSAPTRLFKGDEAADKFMQERMYKPEQPLAYEYAGDVGDFLERLETQYKLPPILPEAVALQYLTGPATSQATRAAGKGAVKAGMALERGMEPVVRGALEQGGLPREMALAMGANTQSNVMKPSNKANWLGGSSIHVPERDMWRFKTPTIAGETPEQRIPRHEELLNDPTLNQDQLDRVKYQLELAKGEAALDKWVDNALMGYFKGQLASPEDPVRLMIERNYANIEAKFAKDQERATKMAQRAEAELDPRKQANMKRQADNMFVQARDDRDVAMQNISHLPSEMLQDIVLDPKTYIKEERVKAGYPAEGLGTTTPSRKWEHQADEAVKVTRAGDIQTALDLQPRLDKALQEQYAVHYEMGQKFGDLLREKGLDEATVESLVKSMPRDQKADAVGMLDELQRVDSNYLRLLDQDRSFPKFAAQDNPFIAKLDPETKMYSGYMGDLGFEHVMDVLRQDLAAERLRPEQLNKLSVEQAVKRTQEYNLELARKMNSDRASARANLPVYKEYPDGYKWVQLNQPGNFAAESQAMGHSVKGYEPRKGDPDWVEGSGNEGSPMYGHGGWDAIKSGRAKIYSLVDSRGAPHATIEIKTNVTASPNDFRVAGLDYSEAMAEAKRRMGLTPETEKELTKSWDGTKRAEASRELHNIIDGIYKERVGEMPQTITQIKGKGNNKPIADYIPYVQDFVRSGNWHSVDDFHHTDLISADTIRKAGWDMSGNTQKFFTKQEYEDLKNAEQKRVEGGGMKRGGKVSISSNPDAMMLELGNKRMKQGGSEDDTKPYFGGAGTKKYAAAKKRAEQVDVNQLKDPKTYAAVASFMGDAPDQLGFSVMHPDYQGIREVADPAFYAGTALGVAPLMKVFKAPTMALGRAGEKYAEKVVPQIMERGGLGAEILGGLAQGSRSHIYLPHTEKKPNPNVGSRFKTQHVGNLAPKHEFDIEANQDSSVMVNPWDLTSRGEKVLEVSDTPLIEPIITEGGHDFARDLAHIQDTIGGASGRQIAERMQDRVNDAYFANLLDKGTGRVFTMPSTMDVTGSNYSTMPTDVIMDFFRQAELNPKDVGRVTDDLRTFTFETERGKFKNAAPVGSPEFMRQLREGGEGFSAGDLRKGFMNRMSKSEYQKMLGYNIEDVYGAIHDPSLKGVPKGFVGNTMIETSPFAEVRPSTHQSYDSANAGKYAGSMPSMPIELMMPDLYEYLERQVLSSPKPTYKDMTPMQMRTMIINMLEKRGSMISQPINQRVVDNVMRYKEGLKQGHFKPNDYDSIMEFMRRTGGYKEGGEVTKPAGGAKLPAAYINGDEFVNAAKKYGIKDSMNNLNKIVDLVNKGLSVDDAARQVADTGMHKAAGGAITGDDLIIEERPL